MTRFGMTYVPGRTPVHRCDARVKTGILFAYSVAVFAVPGWWGMAVLVALLGAVLEVSKLPVGLVVRSLSPVFWLAAFSFVFNVVYNPSVEGLLMGLYVAARMVALVAASFVVCFTTTPEDLLRAFRWLIGPLRNLRVPVDDIALTLALSVRFIPVIEREFEQVRMAQKARGAEAAGSVRRRFAIWGTAFTALFVGLFRHADGLATAMDARCYGASERRTHLPES